MNGKIGLQLLLKLRILKRNHEVQPIHMEPIQAISREIKYYWGELENPDFFNELKNKLK